MPARELPLEALIPKGGPYKPRRTYLKPKDFDKYGFTGGCPGCGAVQRFDGTGGAHTDACRFHMEGLME